METGNSGLAEPPGPVFAERLRQLRANAGLTQEELAYTAGISPRSVSDLERGVTQTTRTDTARRLAGALSLTGAARAEFEAAARGRGPAIAAGATRTLPRDIASFTGREPELRQLAGPAAGMTGAAGAVGVHAIGGMAGVGKTAFAVHAAHKLARQFPDGQIFLPLHGHTPGLRPVDPLDALASLLQISGVAAQQIPPGLQARIALWRDHLASKRLLLLLDDATGHEQVRPLLPGTAGSLVLVTSRRHLTALEDTAYIGLDTLTANDAAALLIRLAGRPGLAPDDAAVDQITRLCGYLPLAIAMLAAQLRHHPAWTAADLVTDLAEARDRLELMEAENLSVTAAFDLSYRDLSPDQKQLFRRLGLHPGVDLDAYAAAALDDTDLASARRGLADLYDQYLLGEPAHGRYRLHDLIRQHSQALAAADPAADRAAAAARLLDYYLHTAQIVSQQLGRPAPGGAAALAAGPPAHVPAFSSRDQAVSWMEAERVNLHAATGHAARHEFPRHATAIPAAMHSFLRSRGYWDQALVLDRAAAETARRDSDQLAEACALTHLGGIQYLTDDYPAATASLTQAADLYHDLGERIGEGIALNRLGAVHSLAGRYQEATATQDRAMGIYRDLGDLRGEANTLSYLGNALRLAGDYPTATARLTRALSLFRDLGDRTGEANVLNNLGVVRYLASDFPAATASLALAAEHYHGLGHRLGEANAVSNLGAAQRLSGDYRAAASSQERALELYRNLGDLLGEASASTELGSVHQVTGQYPAATAILTRAAGVLRDLGTLHGEATALTELGYLQQATGEYRAATASLTRALTLHREISDRHGEASNLQYLGLVQRKAGEYPAAVVSLTRALDLYRQVGSPLGEAESLNGLGELYHASAGPADARAFHEQALEIATGIGAPLQEARALEGIGRCGLRDGHASHGAGALRRALAIYLRIGVPDAERVAATLHEHGC